MNYDFVVQHPFQSGCKQILITIELSAKSVKEGWLGPKFVKTMVENPIKVDMSVAFKKLEVSSFKAPKTVPKNSKLDPSVFLIQPILVISRSPKLWLRPWCPRISFMLLPNPNQCFYLHHRLIRRMLCFLLINEPHSIYVSQNFNKTKAVSGIQFAENSSKVVNPFS